MFDLMNRIRNFDTNMRESDRDRETETDNN